MPNVFVSEGSRKWAHRLNFLREEHRIRMEEPINFVVPVNLLPHDLEGLTMEELRAFQLKLIELLHFAKEQKSKIINIRINDGIYQDRDSFSDLVATIRSIGSHIQAVNYAMSKAPRPLKKRTTTLAVIFKDICYNTLPREQFSELYQRAREIYKESNGVYIDSDGVK